MIFSMTVDNVDGTFQGTETGTVVSPHTGRSLRLAEVKFNANGVLMRERIPDALGDADLRRRLGEGGRAFARARYDPAISAAALEAEHQRLIAEVVTRR